MASNYGIQKPYILIKLPRSICIEDAPRVVIGEVFAQDKNSKKRKRTELSVGIDYDAVNLYDISSARLVTSYPIPPQTTFTCPPCSLRWTSSTKDVYRYTYISTKDLSGREKVSLFKDSLAVSGRTTSTSKSYVHAPEYSIVQLLATVSRASPAAAEGPSLVAVLRDGSMLGFDGETLKKSWETGSSLLAHQASGAISGLLEVHYAQIATAADVVEGIFEGKSEAIPLYEQPICRNGFDPDILLVMTQSSCGRRELHVVAIPDGPKKSAEKPVQVFAVPFPDAAVSPSSPQYQLDAKAASLFELSQGTLHMYSLKGGMARIQHTLPAPKVTSFLRLTDSSLLVSTPTSFEIYNPLYQSIQASTPIEIEDDSEPRTDSIELLSWFSDTRIAVALRGTRILVVQLDAPLRPARRGNKRRAEGLLVDSIGRSLPQEGNAPKRSKIEHKSTAFSAILPGTATETYRKEFQEQTAKADDLFEKKAWRELEEFIAPKFCMELRQHDSASSDELPEWLWPESPADYSRVDRRWILYAISKVLAWDNTDENAAKLTCRVPNESNLVVFLADAGHLSTRNIKSALRNELHGLDWPDDELGEEVPRLLAALSPTMELMVSYLSLTKVGAVELLSATRLIMASLGLPNESSTLKLPIINNGTSHAEGESTYEAEDREVELALQQAEQELQLAEHQLNENLGDRSSPRANALRMAFSKLESCPVFSTVQTLRRLYTEEETLALINILRAQLIRDGWTTRYVDPSSVNGDTKDQGEASDSSIGIIANLLARCIDSMGPSGWLISAGSGGSHQNLAAFLEQLRLEISAALEGVEEAVRLRGVLGEVVQYGTSLQKNMAQQQQQSQGKGKKTKPRTALLLDRESRMLPIGLKTKSHVSAEKVVGGGQVVERSKREIGHLISQQVGPYSLERIVI